MFRHIDIPPATRQHQRILFILLLGLTIQFSSLSFAGTSTTHLTSPSNQSTSHTVSIDTVTVRPGTTFQLALQTSDLTDASIFAFDMVISYNASLITATDATLEGTLSGSNGAGMTLITNMETPGVIKLAAAGANAIAGNGDLVILTFQSLSAVGSTSIAITKSSFNEGAPAITSINGAVHIEDILIGDASLNGDVTSYDASLVLQHLVGDNPLTGDAYTAAETSGNGTVSAYDASLILQYSIGMISCFPAESSCEASKHTANVGAQLTWEAVSSEAAPSYALLVNDIQGSIQAVTIDIELSESNIKEFTPLTPDTWTITSSKIDEDTYRIMFVGTSELVSDTLLTLSLNDAPDALNASYQLNEEAVLSIQTTDVTETPSSYTLNQNYPNPFNPSTTIQYAIPQEAHVTLTIYNMLGREIERLVDDVQQAGSHSISFDATNLASGTYLYRIETPGFTSTRQMLLIK